MSATATHAPAIWTIRTPIGAMYYMPADPSLDRAPDLPPAGLRLAWMPAEFGCLEACIATMLRVGFDEVPGGPRAEFSHAEGAEAMARLTAFVVGRGYQMRTVPITRDLLSRYWIGVSRDPRPCFDHAVVCFCRRVVHDPALRLGFSLPPGQAIAPITQLDEAIVFDRLEDA